MISLIFIALSALFDSQRDKIQFDPKRSFFPSWQWWITRNYMEKKLGGSWVFDTVLSFLNDGWHFCKTLSLLSLFGGILVYSPLFGWGDVVVFWAGYSIVFEISYKS